VASLQKLRGPRSRVGSAREKFQHQLEVEQGRGFLDVEKVVFRSENLAGRSFTPQVQFRPTENPGLHGEAQRIKREHLGQPPREFATHWRGTEQRHISADDVDQSRQVRQTEPGNETTDARRLSAAIPTQRAEAQQLEGNVLKAGAFRAFEDRTAPRKKRDGNRHQ